MGRPKGPPIKIFSLRIREEIFIKLERKAKRSGLAVVDYLRRMIERDVARG